jgi:MFS family permease
MRFTAPFVARAGAPGDPVPLFLRWSFGRGLCARGYWLAASIYLVVVADLSPAELVLVGAAQSLVGLVAEVPAGVLADTVSRKWSLVVAAFISGAGMVMAGLVTSFAAITVSQVLWGLGWAFVSGADVAWITDETRQPAGVDRVLTARARWELTGAAVGVVVHGLIATTAGLATSVVLAGLTMVGLGLYVALRFPEAHFTPAPAGRRSRQAERILREGIHVARRDREILLLIGAWLLVNGSGAGYGRLVERQLVATGFAGTTEAVVSITVLSLAILVISAVGLRALEHRIDRPDAARHVYVAVCATGVVALTVFAHAGDTQVAIAAVVLASGAVHPGALLRTVNEVWINRRAASAVRATVHSLASQAEQLAEVAFGAGLALLAGATDAPTSIIGSAALLGVAALVVARAPQGERAAP